METHELITKGRELLSNAEARLNMNNPEGANVLLAELRELLNREIPAEVPEPCESPEPSGS